MSVKFNIAANLEPQTQCGTLAIFIKGACSGQCKKHEKKYLKTWEEILTVLATTKNLNHILQGC